MSCRGGWWGQAGLALAGGSCQANGGDARAEGWEPFPSRNCQDRSGRSAAPGVPLLVVPGGRGQPQTVEVGAVLETAEDACGYPSLSPAFPPFVSSLA